MERRSVTYARPTSDLSNRRKSRPTNLILAANTRLVGRDFLRFDRSDVGRAYVTLRRSIFALVNAGYFAGNTCVDSPHRSQMCACGGIRHSRPAFIARSEFGYKCK